MRKAQHGARAQAIDAHVVSSFVVRHVDVQDTSLRLDERVALADIAAIVRGSKKRGPRQVTRTIALRRLRDPIMAALVTLFGPKPYHAFIANELLVGVLDQNQPLWAWTEKQWINFLRSTRKFRERKSQPPTNAYFGVAYLLGGFVNFRQALVGFGPRTQVYTRDLAGRVFGANEVEQQLARAREAMLRIGYKCNAAAAITRDAILCHGFLVAGSARLDRITPENLNRLRGASADDGLVPIRSQGVVRSISKALVELGVLLDPVQGRDHTTPGIRDNGVVSSGWADWCERWHSLSPAVTRDGTRSGAMKAGVWLATNHPEVTSPAEWTRPICTEYVRAVLSMKVGDHCRVRGRVNAKRVGHALSPRTRDALLYALRRMFRDLVEWELVELKIDPERALATPQTVYDLIGPDARLIESGAWTKLLWASLNLTERDISAGARSYPLAMVKALAVAFTHCALRRDEILHLRVGCARDQSEDEVDAETGAVLPAHTVCYLHVPANKTSPAFTKPAHPAVLAAFAEWEAVRPSQYPLVDRKTGQHVQILFSYRGAKIGKSYINSVLIPMLCRKAGITGYRDRHGRITSHRARASALDKLQLGGMTLFEVQRMAGHKSPMSTLHYLGKVRPTQLARAFAAADKTTRLIKVLVDREAVSSGAVANGEAWMYYDLGPAGLCANPYWSTCPHRMACVGCTFNVPRASSEEMLLLGKKGLERMQQEVPMTPEESSIVDGDIATFEAAVEKLRAQKALDGRTGAEIASDSERRAAGSSLATTVQLQKPTPEELARR